MCWREFAGNEDTLWFLRGIKIIRHEIRIRSGIRNGTKTRLSSWWRLKLRLVIAFLGYSIIVRWISVTLERGWSERIITKLVIHGKRVNFIGGTKDRTKRRSGWLGFGVSRWFIWSIHGPRLII